MGTLFIIIFTSLMFFYAFGAYAAETADDAAAGMINMHDFYTAEMPFTPHVGVGDGVTRVKFLGKTRYTLAYQAKLGVNYSLTTQTQAFACLRYFGILGYQFKNIVPGIKIRQKA